MAVTSILLAHNLPKVTQQPIPGSLFSSKTDAFVLYNPNSPGPYASQQNLLNHAAVQVCYLFFRQGAPLCACLADEAWHGTG